MRIDNQVADVLANSRVDGELLYLPNRQLDRHLYVRVNKVLEAIGGKWKGGKVNAHIFPECPEDIIEEILHTGQYTDQKKELQFYETPAGLVDLMVTLADYTFHPNGFAYQSTLEPSAGHGAIAALIPKNPFNTLLDIDMKKCGVLSNKFEGEFNIECADFMKWEPKIKYDRVLMNPPFSRQQDIDHVTRALGFLSDSGLLVAIMSASVLYRTNKKTVEFREMIGALGGRIKELPEESFKRSGTLIKTCMVVAGRKALN